MDGWARLNKIGVDFAVRGIWMDPGVTLWEMNPKCGLTGVA